jgi:hypothetical protein
LLRVGFAVIPAKPNQLGGGHVSFERNDPEIDILGGAPSAGEAATLGLVAAAVRAQ